MGGNIPKCPWGLGIERQTILGVSGQLIALRRKNQPI